MGRLSMCRTSAMEQKQCRLMSHGGPLLVRASSSHGQLPTPTSPKQRNRAHRRPRHQKPSSLISPPTSAPSPSVLLRYHERGYLLLETKRRGWVSEFLETSCGEQESQRARRFPDLVAEREDGGTSQVDYRLAMWGTAV